MAAGGARGAGDAPAHPDPAAPDGGGTAPGVVRELRLPPDALVVLVGPSGCGKSTWARAHFRPSQVVSSDECRRLVADDEADQTVNPQAFGVFHSIVRGRLELGRLTVADATNLEWKARAGLLRFARERGRPAVAVVFDYPLALCLARAAARERRVDPGVIERHRQLLDRALPGIAAEGFHLVYRLRPLSG